MVKNNSLKPVLFIQGAFIHDDLTKMIVDMHYPVVLAQTSREVAHYALKTKFSLIILQLDLPPADLLICATALRRTQNRKAPFVGLLSSDSSDWDEMTCLKVGLNDYLKTPVERLTLKQTLDRWIV